MQFDEHVYYGKCSDASIKKNGWNSIIFNRGVIRKLKNGYVYTYEVHICREEYIPEGMAEAIIEAVIKETKLKLPESDMSFRYIKKPENDDVVEILSLEFTKHIKCQQKQSSI